MTLVTTFLSTPTFQKAAVVLFSLSVFAACLSLLALLRTLKQGESSRLVSRSLNLRTLKNGASRFKRQQLGADPTKTPLELGPFGVTILKPLRGTDDTLAGNLRSFFELAAPELGLQLLFGVEGADDPACALVESLIESYPRVDAKLIIHDGANGAANPKVRNLIELLPFVQHKVLVISDANVRVPNDYAKGISILLKDPTVGCVTHLVAPRPTDMSLGTLVESSYLAGYVAPQMSLASKLGIAAAMGKSMAFRHDDLIRLGGLSSVSHVLAEDLVLSRMAGEAGLDVVTAKTPIMQPIGQQTLRGALARTTRWAALRARLLKAPFIIEPLSFPIVVAVCLTAIGLGGFWFTTIAFGIATLRDVVSMAALRRQLSVSILEDPGWHPLQFRLFAILVVLAPLRDALSIFAWLSARFHRRISWRGRSVRMSTGTRLYIKDS